MSGKTKRNKQHANATGEKRARSERGGEKIDRWEFLRARTAYLATLRDEGASPEESMRACNLGDEEQVRLLLITYDVEAAKEKP